ncbi:MAG: hypothetical protein GOU99_03340, partial [Candidatus Altiarchaeota archaeon]|nr:hypothetical protein [Candidatus Altiarchaeota archaeon]
AEQPTIRDAYSYVILGEESACADIHKVDTAFVQRLYGQDYFRTLPVFVYPR